MSDAQMMHIRIVGRVGQLFFCFPYLYIHQVDLRKYLR